MACNGTFNPKNCVEGSKFEEELSASQLVCKCVCASRSLCLLDLPLSVSVDVRKVSVFLRTRMEYVSFFGLIYLVDMI